MAPVVCRGSKLQVMVGKGWGLQRDRVGRYWGLSLLLTGLTDRVGLRSSSLPAFIFPTSISSLPGLLTPKPGAEFKILPYALTAGNKEQKEAIKMYPLHP